MSNINPNFSILDIYYKIYLTNLIYINLGLL